MADRWVCALSRRSFSLRRIFPLPQNPRRQRRLVTLNEGRRAVLLADNDPLSHRAPVVGVWISGGGGGTAATGKHQQQHSARRSSPLSHPLAYPACLRFLLGSRGGGGGGGAGAAPKATAPASPSAFLVLQLPGGVGGGTPACFEACALHAGCAAARSATTAAAADRTGLVSVSSAGFEQLDFSADVDVMVRGSDNKEGGRRGGGGRDGGSGGGGGGSGANRAVVIGRLRRVSNLSAAGGAFARALARERGR